MKKILFISLSFCIILTKANAQTPTTSTLNNYKVDADMLLRKSKKQKLTAWILLGSGSFVWYLGANKHMNQLDNVDGGGGAPMLIGGIAALSSIPIFNMASKNKKKSISITFRNETAPKFCIQGIVSMPIPSLSLKLSL